MTLTWDHLTTDDATQLSELTKAVAQADGHSETYEPEDMLEELQSPSLDLTRQTFAVRDGDRLVAAAEVNGRDSARFDGLGQVGLTGFVHPEFRGRGIGTELIVRSEPVAHALAAERTPGVDYVLRASGWTQNDPSRPLLTDHGYTLARHFHQMRRGADGADLPDLTQREDGVVVRPFTADDAEATRLAHNDAFTTHWGSGPSSAARWAEVTGSRALRPEHSRIAVDADGQVLAYVLAGQWVDGELYVELVGTRQQAQGRGLGRAVLNETIRSASTAGVFDRIELDVDSDNPSDAGKLYTRLGFQTVLTTAVFQKQFTPGAVLASAG